MAEEVKMGEGEARVELDPTQLVRALRSGEVDPAQVVRELQSQMEQVANLQGLLQQQQFAAAGDGSQQLTAATSVAGFKLKPRKPDLFEGKRPGHHSALETSGTHVRSAGGSSCGATSSLGNNVPGRGSTHLVAAKGRSSSQRLGHQVCHPRSVF